ncbi:MAG: carbamoyltransferase HypF [Ignisphaera sp.]
MQDLVKGVKIRVVGVVQGVGFRPFVYRLAKKLSLNGYVVNLGGSEVEIYLEGYVGKIEEFMRRLFTEKPPNAKIVNIVVEEVEPLGYRDFTIFESKRETVFRSMVPPDIAICRDCIEEILNPHSRFYRYPWNSCAWCGPRFSMMYAVPYDRHSTAMAIFKFCSECEKSYKDPNDARRFHGQGISCAVCGPKTYVYTNDGKRLDVRDPVKFVAEKILEGSIVAIKGVGGYHIACLASRDSIVAELRVRKGRPYQPFALMARDFSIVEEIAIPPPGAKELLESPQRPIVVMPKKEGSRVSYLVAPGLSTIGVMLPYTGFQVLLLNEIPDGFLIMTSGNMHGEPMCINFDCVLAKLRGVVDYIVEHERNIVHRVDDSVIRFTDGEPVFLRRGRGYAPEWVEVLVNLPHVIALGAEMQTAGAVAFDNKVVLTQFIGDLDNIEALEDLKKEVLWFINSYSLKPKIIAIDMHPQYHNRLLAKDLSEYLGAEIIEVQHHHAHAVSVLSEYLFKSNNRAIAITIDGTGFGIDGGIWGGEVLLTTYENFKRCGCLHPFVLPGGDSAAAYPVKSLIALMVSAGFSEEEVFGVLQDLSLINTLNHGYEEAIITYTLARRGKGVVTTSMGRVLDAFSALLRICTKRTYEGEPPMKLEALADKALRELDYDPKLRVLDGMYVVDVNDLLRWVIENIGVYRVEDIALTVLKGLGRGLGYVAVKCLKGLRNTEQIVAVGGGAAVNTYIVRGIKEILRGEELNILLPKKVPPGDGGIALGQTIISSQVVDLG